MKQNDAVFQAVCSVLGQDSFNSAVELSKSQRESVVGMVVKGIMEGGVDFSTEARSKHDTEQKVKSYTTGMVSNHLRKDKRLNGNIAYEIKNPGSRAGSGDDQLKAMKALKSTLTDSKQIKILDDAINNRIAELSVKKVVTIDIDALPEEFRHLVK